MYLWQDTGIGDDESSVIPDVKVSLVQSQILVAQVQLARPIRLRYLQKMMINLIILSIVLKSRQGAIQIIRDTLGGPRQCHQMTHGGGGGVFSNFSRDKNENITSHIQSFSK